MSAALELHDVVKRYGRRRALDGCSMTVPEGSVLGLVGSNGAGKTTLLCAAAGLLKLHGGSINLFGEGPFDPGHHAGAVSILPQDAQLPGHSSLRETLIYFARLQGLSRQDADGDVDRVLHLVHLADRSGERIRTLSHGMRRRAAIAQALLGDPRLLLLDEPLNGLDPVEVANIRALLKARDGKRTIVISSHILKEVEAVCDHVAFIEKGKLVRQGSLHHITHARGIMLYLLDRNSFDVAELQKELPEHTITFDPSSCALTIAYDPELLDGATLNRQVLPVLLRLGAGVLQIRPGNDLEREYLNLRES